MTGWWLASYLILWTLVVLLGVVVLVVLRQLGLLYVRDEGTHGPSPRGPREGDRFEALHMDDSASGDVIRFPHPDKPLSLMVLVSPDCAACKAVLSATATLRDDRNVWTVVVANGGEGAASAVRTVLGDGTSVVVSDEIDKSLEVPFVPWTLLVDRQGLVRHGGPVGNVDALQGILDAASGSSPSGSASFQLQVEEVG